MIKNWSKLHFFLILSFIFMWNAFCVPMYAAQPVSVVALTWNMGNKAAQESIVEDFLIAIKANGYPQIILLATQEELAQTKEQLNNRLLAQLSKLGEKYTLIENSHKTAAGAQNAPKTAAVSLAQKTRLSKKLDLPQNRTSLSIFVKNGYALNALNKPIYYPPGQKESNNSFIVIEGNFQKESDPTSLSISVASVHLNSFSDKARRLHANEFFQRHFKASPNYDDILKEAKRFDLIMGDFNEREYLMKDNSVVDRGYLTNFVAYGYDFSQAQQKPSHAYGTYGFTKASETVTRFHTAESLKDPRNRPHNAKGGFLDRITFTSGLSVQSRPQQYGAVVDPEKFKLGKKILYSQSDHLPVIRYFTIKVSSSEDEKIVKEYIKRRIPNFEKEIQYIEDLIHDNKLESIRLKAEKFIFYDSKESTDDFLKKFSNLSSLTAGLSGKLMWKKKDLEVLQGHIRDLRKKIDNSQNKNFLEKVYNKITACNKNRNLSLEKMDDNKAAIKWYIPNSLSQDNFKEYQDALTELNGLT